MDRGRWRTTLPASSRPGEAGLAGSCGPEEKDCPPRRPCARGILSVSYLCGNRHRRPWQEPAGILLARDSVFLCELRNRADSPEAVWGVCSPGVLWHSRQAPHPPCQAERWRSPGVLQEVAAGARQVRRATRLPRRPDSGSAARRGKHDHRRRVGRSGNGWRGPPRSRP